jgi:hypothetical protein
MTLGTLKSSLLPGSTNTKKGIEHTQKHSKVDEKTPNNEYESTTHQTAFRPNPTHNTKHDRDSIQTNVVSSKSRVIPQKKYDWYCSDYTRDKDSVSCAWGNPGVSSEPNYRKKFSGNGVAEKNRSIIYICASVYKALSMASFDRRCHNRAV